MKVNQIQKIRHKRMIGILLGAMTVAVLAAGCGKETKSEKTQPITVTVWNYYNGDQLEAFNTLVDEFNETVGEEQGITVESYSQGSISDLETNLLNSAEEKAGAAELPNIFSAYQDTTYALHQLGKVADVQAYLTEEEKSAYIEGYLSEGDFLNDGSIRIFPIVKSTELLCLNDTDWQPFAAATGASYEDLATMEGLLRTAELYYNWTDAQTPEAGDGRALFGRDAMANYMLIGARQLDCTIFQVQDGKMTLDFNKQVMRKLWDYYYVPFIKGYFAATGRFRSDDIKTGNIIVYQGSSTSVSFFPSQVIKNETESYDIQMKVLPAPVFEGGQNVAVQQGAGMAVTTGSEEEIKASVTFLKWLTKPENNIRFSVNSGYVPVTKYANNMDHIRKSGLEMTDSMEEILEVTLETINSRELYTTNAFVDGQSARQVLDYALSDQANQDRAIVKERIAAGMDSAQAEAEFLSEEAFEKWYQKTWNDLKQYEN